MERKEGERQIKHVPVSSDPSRGMDCIPQIIAYLWIQSTLMFFLPFK